jgi:radical SAM superfamily enzyme YgiQ (UPF0313 family)
MGIESGSEKIRNNVLNRRMKNSQIVKIFQSAKKIGIRTKSYNMMGIPFENESNIQETINLNKMIQPDEVQVSFFTAYPGTKLYDICKENGWISSKLPSSYFTDTNVNYPKLPKRKIKEYYKRFAFEVYSKTDFKKAMLYLIKANFYQSYQRIRDKIPDRFKGGFWQSSSLRA